MKFCVTFKDPDVLSDAIGEAVAKTLKAASLSEDEQDAVFDIRYQEAANYCGRWFDFGEYITVEVDTEADTCIVIPTKEQKQ